MDELGELGEKWREPEPEGAGKGPRVATLIGLTIGGMFVVGMCAMQPTMGATRSARLKRQERQREIEDVVRQTGAAEEAGHGTGHPQ